MKNAILKKIEENTVVVGVIGLGYVGLPLAVTFARQGLNVLGFEKSQEKADKVNRGENYIGDITDEDLRSVVETKTLLATTDFSRIKECDAAIICVPTPLDKFKKPDMRFIEASCRDIGRFMTKGTFVSLESTTYPTTTEDFMLPILEEESGLSHGKDFWLAFSPERVDPGNEDYKTDNTPKVFGALDEDGKEVGLALYRKAIKHLYPVSSPRVAEMVKILENTYRLVNISLVNELALLSGKMDIDIWEVIDAAKSKPYGFQAFYPGPGIGGHCIPLDPFYLEHIAKKYDFDLTMIHTAGHIDTLMAHRMTIKITSALNQHKKALNGSKILFLGVAYKPNIDDARESPALKIMDEVVKKGGVVSYHDPFVAQAKTPDGNDFESVSFEHIKEADAVVVTTKHKNVDMIKVIQESKLIVDLCNSVETGTSSAFKL
ncbi:MAG: nucleotide sugar dehydrogenase [Spirochaetales bacterium]|nr:nucleotide sugar dehydrogenase [Spirochaetales bacterium]